MAKSNPFSIDDITKKGYELNDKGQYEKPIHKNLDIYPKSFTEAKSDEIKDVSDVRLDIKTEWFIKDYQVPALKNSKQIIPRKGGGFFIIPSKKHKEYVTATAMQFTMYGIEFRRAIKVFGIEYPYRVEFTFIRNSKHRADFSNLVQTIEELMVANAWIEDDDMLHIIPSFQPVEYDKVNFGVRIKLLTK